MGGFLTLLYGVVSYVVFLFAFLYAIGFVGDFLLPFTLDQGREGIMPTALIIDAILLSIFAVQHTVMARRGFKRWLTSWLPAAAERSTYVLLSSLALILLYWQWRPIPGVVWSVEASWASWLLYGLFALGWLLVFTGTFVINHFDLFGLRQVWLRARGVNYTELEFKDSLYYRMIRHPLMLGFIIAFWATPEMTYGHLLFAIATTAYILIAVKFFEERDLVAMHGQAYVDYQSKVPMICPWPRPHRADAAQVPPDNAVT